MGGRSGAVAISLPPHHSPDGLLQAAKCRSHPPLLSGGLSFALYRGWLTAAEPLRQGEKEDLPWEAGKGTDPIRPSGRLCRASDARNPATGPAWAAHPQVLALEFWGHSRLSCAAPSCFPAE